MNMLKPSRESFRSLEGFFVLALQSLLSVDESMS